MGAKEKAVSSLKKKTNAHLLEKMNCNTTSLKLLFLLSSSGLLTAGTVEFGGFFGHLLGLFEDGVDTTNHVEGHFGDLIVVTHEETGEGVDGVVEFDEVTLHTSEDFGDLEGLGEELGDLAGTVDGELVFFGELINTKDGNNVLEFLVLGEHLDDILGDVVVVDGDDVGVHDTGGAFEGVDGGVDTGFGDGTIKDGGGVKVGEGGGGGRIGDIVGGDVDGLDGGNGTLGGGGNTFLEHTKIFGEGGLVTDGGGNTAEEGRDFGVGLGEAENVVNEEQDILAFDVTEVFGHGEGRLGDTGAGTRGFVHLTVDKDALGFAGKVDDLGLHHFEVQVGTFTGTFTDTSEDGETTVTLGDVVNEFHDNDGLADTSTTEETDLTTLAVGENEINDLDTGGENGVLGGLVSELGGDGVDGELGLLADGATLVDGFTEDVEDAAEGFATDGDGNLTTSGDDLGLELEEIGGLHGNAATGVGVQVLDDFEGEGFTTAEVIGDVEGGEDGGNTFVEVDVDDGTDDLGDVTDATLVGSGTGGASTEGSVDVAADSGRGSEALHILLFSIY